MALFRKNIYVKDLNTYIDRQYCTQCSHPMMVKKMIPNYNRLNGKVLDWTIETICSRVLCPDRILYKYIHIHRKNDKPKVK